MKPIEWTAAEREARETGRFVIVGREDGRGSRHVVWVSRWATTAAYPPEGICDRESWVSFEPLFTGEEVAERERAAAAKALRDAAGLFNPVTGSPLSPGDVALRLHHVANRVEAGEQP